MVAAAGPNSERIVLIHGFPFDHRMWEAQAHYLRGRGHEVLTPDLPGFGHTGGVAAEGASVENFASYIAKYIREEAGGRAIVGGFSMGGYVLLALLREHPELVKAAMFINTRADADSEEARANRQKQIEELQTNGPAGLITGMLEKQLIKRPLSAVSARARELMEGHSIDALCNALRAMGKRPDRRDLLPTLKLPVLAIVGAEDKITPPSGALAMQTQMPHAMVVQIVGAGHLSPVEQPDPVNGAIETFLATIR